MLNLLIPVLMLQCTDLRALSGTLNTSLAEDTTCWNLRCVGRLQLVHRRNFDGYLTVDTGFIRYKESERKIELYAEDGTTELKAYWDVELSAHMDECADGNCDSAVQFSWGCNTAAPAIEDSIEDSPNPDGLEESSGYVHKDDLSTLTTTHFPIPCTGTFELEYRLDSCGQFRVRNGMVLQNGKVFFNSPLRLWAYPTVEAGVVRFKADGLVRLERDPYFPLYYCQANSNSITYTWGCNKAAPSLPQRDAPKFTPNCGLFASKTLDAAGSVRVVAWPEDGFENGKCWALACEGGTVEITFSKFYMSENFLNVYEMDGDQVANFSFHETGRGKLEQSYTFQGSVIVQYDFVAGWRSLQEELEFNYVCKVATRAPKTLSPTEPPATGVPSTPAPATESPHSSSVEWCVSDGECQKYGDEAATCDTYENKCTCGLGFEKPRNKHNGNVAHICVNNATRVSDVVHITLDVDCDDGAAKGQRLASVVRSVVKGTVSDVHTECGSLNVLVSMDNVPLLEVAALDMVEELTAGMSAAGDVVGTVQSAGLASMDALQCRDVKNAEVVAILDGMCVPMKCAADHFLDSLSGTVLGKVCVVLTPSPSSSPSPSDSLAVGAIVGICVGAVAFISIIIIAIILCIKCKKESNPATSPDSEREPVQDV